MFTIPVGDLINSYDGDSKTFSFEGEVFNGFFEDISIIGNLTFKIKLLSIDDGIHATFSNLDAQILYEGKKEKIFIKEFDRDWKLQLDPLDPNDVYEINNKNMTIDLAPVVREELIMAFHNQNL